MVNVGKYTIHGSYGIVHLKISRWKRRFLLETSISRWTMLNFGGVFFHFLFIVISISREDCLYLTDIFQTSWNHRPVDFWKLIEHPSTKTWHLNNISWNHQVILNLHKPSWNYDSTFFQISKFMSLACPLYVSSHVFLWWKMFNQKHRTTKKRSYVPIARSMVWAHRFGAKTWRRPEWKAEICLQLIILKRDIFHIPNMFHVWNMYLYTCHTCMIYDKRRYIFHTFDTSGFFQWTKRCVFGGVPPSPMSLGEANEIANRLKAGNLRRWDPEAVTNRNRENNSNYKKQPTRNKKLSTTTNNQQETNQRPQTTTATRRRNKKQVTRNEKQPTTTPLPPLRPP